MIIIEKTNIALADSKNWLIISLKLDINSFSNCNNLVIQVAVIFILLDLDEWL